MNFFRLLILAGLGLAMTGCGMPHDPHGTFDRVRGGVIRVGIIDHPPWAEMAPVGPRGVEVELVATLAADLQARCEWVPGAESELLEALTQRELDLVIGGLTESTPWADQLGISQPYMTENGKGHVVAVPAGENRWLLEIDRFLQSPRATTDRPEPTP